MAQILKIVLGLAIILIVLVGLYFWFMDRNEGTALPPGSSAQMQFQDLSA